MVVSQFMRGMSAAKSVVIEAAIDRDAGHAHRVDAKAAHVTDAEAADMRATNDAHVSTSEAADMTPPPKPPKPPPPRARAAPPVVAIRRTAEELNRRGILAPRGGEWQPTTVVRLLARLRVEAG